MAEVSVIIPAFNAAWCVGEAIASVAHQTFRDVEVIVVDDGSTDRTAEVARTALDESGVFNAKVVSHPTCRQVGAARNRGIDEADGTYVAFLDADDRWDPEKLERVLSIFDGRPQVGLVCHYERAVQNGKVLRINRYGPWREEMYEHLLFEDNCLSPSATVVRRELLLQIQGFSEDPALTSVEDYDLWMRLSQITEFVFCPEVLGEHRHIGGSLSSRVEYHLRQTLNVLEQHFDKHFAGRPLTHEDHQRVARRKSVVYRHAAREAQRRRDWQSARRYVAEALRLYPFAPKTLTLGGLIGLRVPM
jgi:glycosyltransferase involved in cell wall biosynthesis